MKCTELSCELMFYEPNPNNHFGQVREQKLAKWKNDFWPNGGIGKIFCIFVVAIKAIRYGKSI